MITSSGVPNRTAWYKQGRFVLRRPVEDIPLPDAVEQEQEDDEQDS